MSFVLFFFTSKAESKAGSSTKKAYPTFYFFHEKSFRTTLNMKLIKWYVIIKYHSYQYINKFYYFWKPKEEFSIGFLNFVIDSSNRSYRKLIAWKSIFLFCYSQWYFTRCFNLCQLTKHFQEVVEDIFSYLVFQISWFSS